MRRALLVLGVPLLLAACGESTGPDDSHSLSGHWESSSSGSEVVRITISVTNREVTGHGSMTNAFNTIPVIVEGTYVPPSVSLNLGLERFEDINFEGSFEDDDTLTGTLRGSGFEGEAVTFTRVEEEG